MCPSLVQGGLAYASWSSSISINGSSVANVTADGGARVLGGGFYVGSSSSLTLSDASSITDTAAHGRNVYGGLIQAVEACTVEIASSAIAHHAALSFGSLRGGVFNLEAESSLVSRMSSFSDITCRSTGAELTEGAVAFLHTSSSFTLDASSIKNVATDATSHSLRGGVFTVYFSSITTLIRSSISQVTMTTLNGTIMGGVAHVHARSSVSLVDSNVCDITSASHNGVAYGGCFTIEHSTLRLGGSVLSILTLHIRMRLHMLVMCRLDASILDILNMY